MNKQELDKLIFSLAVARVDEQYGVRNQFTVEGDTLENFMLLPRLDRGYDEQDMRELAIDADYLAEQIRQEAE